MSKALGQPVAYFFLRLFVPEMAEPVCFALSFFDASFCYCREDLHKMDVMNFCQHKIITGCDLSTQRGRDSSLLWKFLVLLCRQNGVGIP